MKHILFVIALSLSSGAIAAVNWNQFSVNEEIQYEVDSEIKTNCPRMYHQEVFQVVNVTSTNDEQYTVELQGRGYGSGDPDHHFIIILEKYSNGIPREHSQFEVVLFSPFAECH